MTEPECVRLFSKEKEAGKSFSVKVN
ncbi:DUF1187 family protein, partial [Escherichia coli]|nr:DUF1187 family protein [Escherichia coli]